MAESPRVEGRGLAVRPRRDGAARGREAVLEQRRRVAGGLGVVGETGRLGAGVEQRVEDRAVQLATARAGEALLHGAAAQLVAEAREPVVDDDQAPLLALGQGGGAVGAEAALEHRDLRPAGDDAHHLERRAGGGREPRGPGEHGVAHGRRRALQAGADRLRDEEGVAARRRVERIRVAADARELADRVAAERRQLDAPRPARGDPGRRAAQRVVGGQLVVAERDHAAASRPIRCAARGTSAGRASPRRPSARPRPRRPWATRGPARRARRRRRRCARARAGPRRGAARRRRRCRGRGRAVGRRPGRRRRPTARGPRPRWRRRSSPPGSSCRCRPRR